MIPDATICSPRIPYPETLILVGLLGDSAYQKRLDDIAGNPETPILVGVPGGSTYKKD